MYKKECDNFSKKCLVRGFSLLEVMVAIAIGGVLVFTFIKVMDNMKKIESAMLDRQEAMELVSILKISTSSYHGCKALFDSAKDSEGRIPLEGEFSKITNSTGRDIVIVGKKYGRLILDGITYSSSKESFIGHKDPLQEGIINVRVKFKGKGKNRGFVKRVPISILGYYAPETKKWFFKNCLTVNSQMIIDISKDVSTRVCLSLGTVYDEVKEKCEFDLAKSIEKATDTDSSSKSQIDKITNSVMVQVCKSLEATYDSANKKCQIDLNSSKLKGLQNSFDPSMMKKIMEMMMKKN